MRSHSVLNRWDGASAIGILNVLTSNRSYVVYEMPGLFCGRENRFVNQLTLRVQLARKHALTAKALERMMKAADTCKKVDELEL